MNWLKKLLAPRARNSPVDDAPAVSHAEPYLRRAKTDDIPFILDVIEEGARARHYRGGDLGNEQLLALITATPVKKVRPTRDGQEVLVDIKADAWILEGDDGTREGFAVVKHPEKPATHPLYRKAELWLASVRQASHGQGHGKFLLDEVLTHYDGKAMMVRCEPVSTTMIAMLQRRGFKRKTVNGQIVLDR